MPADRTTKTSKRIDMGNQLVWNPQPALDYFPSSESTFCDVSTIDFYSDCPPPLVDAPPPPPAEFIMFPPPDSEAGPVARRQTHSKKKPENHIPRPPNAFILFRSSFIKSQHVSTEVETNHSTLSKIIGLTWQSLPDEERQIWHTKAKEALDEHKRKFPKYAFRPVQTKAKGAPSEKRKVREVEPKDVKRCAKIAQLLVEGMKGNELKAAVKEFDKHHVPQVVTRFETPITARTYRRSSSVPVPETEKARENQTFFVKEESGASQPTQRKVRAASTRPTRCSTPAVVVPVVAPVQQQQQPALPFPLKQEASMTFPEFSFQNVSSPMQSFECDPFFLSDYQEVGPYSPALTVDTSFGDWSSSPSPGPLSPSSCSDIMTTMSSPVLSPAASFSPCMEHFELTSTQKAHFDAYGFPVASFEQPAFATGFVDQAALFNAGSYTAQQQHVDFSAYMSSIPQFDI